MDDRHLRETTLYSEELLQGEFLQVYRDQVHLPDGTTGTREYVRHPGAVMIVPLLETDNCEWQVVLERQFRYPMSQVMVEFPAGKLDPGEDTFLCAQRELMEETGYSATEWARAGVMHPVISYSTEFIEIWFARGLTAGVRQLGQGEFLDVFAAPVPQLFQWCYDGTVTDAKTLAGVLWLQNIMSGVWTLHWQTTTTPMFRS